MTNIADDKDDIALTPWHCPGCKAQIGETTPNGLLVIGGIALTVGEFHCVHCGHRRMWHRSDKTLDGLIEKLLSHS